MSAASLPPSLEHGSEEEPNISRIPDESQTHLAREENSNYQEKAVGDKATQGFVVGFRGPQDTTNPRHWSVRKKWLNIAVISVISTVT